MVATKISFLAALACLGIFSLEISAQGVEQEKCDVWFRKSPDGSSFEVRTSSGSSTVFVDPNSSSWKAYINNEGQQTSIDSENNETSEPKPADKDVEAGGVRLSHSSRGLFKQASATEDLINKYFHLNNPPAFASKWRLAMATNNDNIILDVKPAVQFHHLFLQRGDILTLVRPDCTVDTRNLKVASPGLQAFVNEVVEKSRASRG